MTLFGTRFDRLTLTAHRPEGKLTSANLGPRRAAGVVPTEYDMAFSNPFSKVSVYIVNHNYGAYVAQAIESVLNQSFDDFELLILDNGSEDGSREIISRYQRHKKIRAIFQDNIGLNATNNVAIRRSKGRYVLRLDADDFLHPNALELLAGVLDRRPEVGLVFPDYFLTDQTGKVMEIMQRHNFDEVTLLDQPAHGACTMIRRECLEALNGYDESYHCQDGWDLWVRFIRQFGVANLNLPLFYYRQHGESLTRNEQKILDTRSLILKRSAEAGSRLSSLAVIPIRGPAVDRRSLALRPIGGKPLLEWTVDAALAANRVSRVAITSPDAAVEAHVRAVYGDRVGFISRNWDLALPSKDLDETLTDLFDTLPDEWRDFGALGLLFIESPFRGAREIDAAIDALEVFGSNRVVGVRHLDRQLYCHQGSGLVPLSSAGLLRKESQEIYRLAGGIIVIRRGQFYRDTEKDMRLGHIEVDEWAAHKLSTEWSWSVAEAHAEQLKKRIASEAAEVGATRQLDLT
jgi:CMP-N-acetylneuraminic acid synthetase